jgi:dynein heavy chain
LRLAFSFHAELRPPHDTSHQSQAHPSFYEAVPGGLQEVRQRVEALQRKFNEESKVS